MAFAALDGPRERHEIDPVVDGIDGTSLDAGCAGLERVIQARAQQIG